MKKQKWIIHGWFNNDDYENGKPANHYVILTAKDESEADEKGDKKITKLYGTCEVIVSNKLNK